MLAVPACLFIYGIYTKICMKLFSTLSHSSFLRHNAVFFFGSLLIGILNYAFYPVIGHLLPVDGYGEVQALVSFFAQLTIFLNVLSQVAINVITNYTDEDQKQRVILELEKLGFAISIVILVAGSLGSWWLASFFHFGSIWPLIIMLLAFVATVPLSFRGAYLRAKKQFGHAAFAGIISSASEIMVSATLVVIGLGAAGAIGGLIVAQLLAFGYAAYRSRQVGFRKPEGIRYFAIPDFNAIAPELRYGLFVLLLSMVITVFSTADVFIVKHYFSPRIAGEYSGVSVIAKSVFFVTAPIAQVLMPHVHLHSSQRSNLMALVKSLGLVVCISGCALLLFFVAPKSIIGTLMGHKFLPYARLLPRVGLAMLLLSVINVFISYSIALRDYLASVIVTIGIGLAWTLILLHHNNVSTIITSLIDSAAILLGMFILWTLHSIARTQGKARNEQ